MLKYPCLLRIKELLNDMEDLLRKMDSGVHIRNLTIGEGRTKICVPIVGRNHDEIISQAQKVVEAEPDIIEWRCDYYESMYDEDVEMVLIDLRKTIGEIPLLFTFRTDVEGGEKFISNDNYFDLNVTVAKTGMADLIDIEAWSKSKIAMELITEIHQAGCKVVASSHNFEKTPSVETMEKILMTMEEYGPDICKLAVMPRKHSDVEALVQASIEANKKMIAPIITMSMGKIGAITRVASKTTGSVMTFATAGETSAPGQLECSEVKKILDLADNMNVEKNIMLIGFMGTGKTTTSRALKYVTGLEEVDMDKYIVEKEKMTIPQIFEKFGEDVFRQKETEALKEIQKSGGKIVSCGGGVVLKDENIDIMKKDGIVILLTATPDTVFDRVKNSKSRPILNTDMSVEHVTRLMNERQSRYEKAKDVEVSTDDSDSVRICMDIMKAVCK